MRHDIIVRQGDFCQISLIFTPHGYTPKQGSGQKPYVTIGHQNEEESKGNRAITTAELRRTTLVAIMVKKRKIKAMMKGLSPYKDMKI